MAKRVSHSLLDPLLTPPIKELYRQKPIPPEIPPEAIIGVGHLMAILAALGFAFATTRAWGGLIVALGVAANHVCDVLDGTHARATGQCRNGGELLDHFTDPLSFSYWMTGLAVSCGQLNMGIAAVIIIYATAVLTNIRAKMTGEFALAVVGPTEFKCLLVLYGLFMFMYVIVTPEGVPLYAGLGFLWLLILAGVVQLVVMLILSVRDVNRLATPPDTTEWQTRSAPPDETPPGLR